MRNKIYKYSVDIINNKLVSGWCFNRLKKNSPVTLTFFSGRKKLGSTLADQKRSDLYAHELHPSGHCGFTFAFPEIHSGENSKHISISVNKGRKPLTSFSRNQVTRVMEEPLPHILFMHIPKTAGTSFNTFARGYFSTEKTIIHVERGNKKRCASFENRYSFISGHMPIRSLKKHFDLSRFDLYTILREPYSHIHSHLNWVQSIITKPNSGFCREHPLVVLDMAKKIQSLNLNKPNVLHSFIQNLNSVEMDFFDNCQTRYFLDSHPAKVRSIDLDNAIQNMTHFRTIGITEQYDKFTQDFCQQYRAIHCEQTKIHNQAKSKVLFDHRNQDIRAALYPLVRVDLKLYEHVCNSSDGSSENQI